ncbi:hypothetical protein [Trujillonella endophytica]|uniref:Uncharacterized protein n=1 Tax=Trujillonella endophytica TaxID=673521 RepID=A0A1H8SFM6_9ACTN|nr:hypothetical protein [Trujillella endophytica]SEO77357.1 hypothetical protein SAMN05660991_01666 [Trujillella endophytica]
MTAPATGRIAASAAGRRAGRAAADPHTTGVRAAAHGDLDAGG